MEPPTEQLKLEDELEIEAVAQPVQELTFSTDGSAFRSAADRAGNAIAELRSKALDHLFPAKISPTSADAYEALRYYSGRTSGATYGLAMASIHGRSLDLWPELADLIRRPEVLRDVGRAAAAQAERVQADGGSAAEKAIAEFQRTIAEQLASADHSLAGAAAKFLAAEQLRTDLEAELERRKSLAAELLEAERRREAEAAAIREREARRRATKAEAAAREAELEVIRKREAARLARAEALVEELKRLKVAGYDSLRVAGGNYDISATISIARGLSAEQLSAWEQALKPAEAVH